MSRSVHPLRQNTYYITAWGSSPTTWPARSSPAAPLLLTLCTVICDHTAKTGTTLPYSLLSSSLLLSLKPQYVSLLLLPFILPRALSFSYSFSFSFSLSPFSSYHPFFFLSFLLILSSSSSSFSSSSSSSSSSVVY